MWCKISVPLVFYIAFFEAVRATRECTGTELARSDRLRVSIKSRPPTCAHKTANGDVLTVHYEARFFRDCTVFDSSIQRGSAFQFTLGAREVIQGWDDGLMSMCIGEIRKLTIPGHLAYIDGRSLIYEVELMDVSG
jgi:FK506-binding protein 2